MYGRNQVEFSQKSKVYQFPWWVRALEGTNHAAALLIIVVAMGLVYMSVVLALHHDWLESLAPALFAVLLFGGGWALHVSNRQWLFHFDTFRLNDDHLIVSRSLSAERIFDRRGFVHAQQVDKKPRRRFGLAFPAETRIKLETALGESITVSTLLTKLESLLESLSNMDLA